MTKRLKQTVSKWRFCVSSADVSTTTTQSASPESPQGLSACKYHTLCTFDVTVKLDGSDLGYCSRIILERELKVETTLHIVLRF